jgi:hypothetical protein
LASEAWTHERASIPDLVTRVGDEARALAADILQLVEREAKDRVEELRSALVLLGAALVTLLVGLTALVAAAVAGLATALPVWAAALVVAAVVLILGFALAGTGLARLKRSSRAPRETVEVIREGTQWLKQRSAP